jgi:hypothetical protein
VEEVLLLYNKNVFPLLEKVNLVKEKLFWLNLVMKALVNLKNLVKKKNQLLNL